MADSSVITEFLVSLGFKLDETQARKFDDVLRGSRARSMEFDKTLADLGKQLGVVGDKFIQLADKPHREYMDATDKMSRRNALLTQNVKQLGLTAATTTATFVAGFAEIARQYQNLYYVQQRTGMSGNALAGLQYVGPQIGLGKDSLVQATEALATATRNPGLQALLRSWGIANNDVIAFIGHLRGMPPYLQDAYAQMFGISTGFMRNVLNNWDITQKAQEDFVNRAKAAGLDYNKVNRDAVEATRQLETIWSQLGMIATQGFEEAFPWVHKVELAMVDLLDTTIKWNASHPGAALAENLAAAVVSGTALLRILGLLPGMGAAAAAGRALGPVGAGAAAAAYMSPWAMQGEYDRAADSKDPYNQLPYSHVPFTANWFKRHGHIMGLYGQGGIVPSFAEGGIMPAGLHAKEMVLPANISEGLQSMFSNGGGLRNFSDHFMQWLVGNSAYRPMVQVVGLTPGSPMTSSGGGTVPPPGGGSYSSPGRPGSSIATDGSYATGAGATGGSKGDPRGQTAALIAAAIANHVNPDDVLAIARREGLGAKKYATWDVNNWSYGAMQMHVGGLATEYQKATGKDPANPANEADMNAWAVHYGATKGWRPWTTVSSGQAIVPRRLTPDQEAAYKQKYAGILGGTTLGGGRGATINHDEGDIHNNFHQTNNFYGHSGHDHHSTIAHLNHHAGLMLRNVRVAQH